MNLRSEIKHCSSLVRLPETGKQYGSRHVYQNRLRCINVDIGYKRRYCIYDVLQENFQYTIMLVNIHIDQEDFSEACTPRPLVSLNDCEKKLAKMMFSHPKMVISKRKTFLLLCTHTS